MSPEAPSQPWPWKRVKPARSCSLVLPLLPKRLEHGGSSQRDDVKRCFDQLAGAELAELWLVEQSPARTWLSELSQEYQSQLPLQHITVPSRRRFLERGRLVNQVLPQARADWLWVHHPHLELSMSHVLEALAVSAADVVQTFDVLRRQGAERPAAPGKLSWAVQREALLAVGGLHEALLGEDDEGFEALRRLRSLGLTVETLRQVARFEPPAASAEERRVQLASKELRQRLYQRWDEDPDRYFAALDSSLTSTRAGRDEWQRRRRRERALALTAPHPPVEKPAQLSGDLWAITTFFNPAGYRNKSENYRHFREGLAAAGVPLLCVELAFEGGAHELGPEAADILVQRRARRDSVLWQKERLLNLAVELLPPQCDRVAWLDADVLFDNPSWAQQTEELLLRHVVVQPFELSVRLEPGETSIDVAELPLGNAEHEVLHSIAYGVYAKGPSCLDRYLAHGHSGYAWAARRSLLERHGLYDANILGNADLNIAHAMFSGERDLKLDRLSERAQRHLRAWARRFHEDVAGSVAFVPGVLYHLWHGNKADRLYDRRLQVLIENDYDPEQDLAVAEEGYYRWASDKPELHAWCARYFEVRREEGQE